MWKVQMLVHFRPHCSLVNNINTILCCMYTILSWMSTQYVASMNLNTQLICKTMIQFWFNAGFATYITNNIYYKRWFLVLSKTHLHWSWDFQFLANDINLIHYGHVRLYEISKMHWLLLLFDWKVCLLVKNHFMI